MGIDATDKFVEEVETLITSEVFVSCDVEGVRNTFPEILHINDALIRMGALFLAVKKSKPGHIKWLHRQLLAKGLVKNVKFIVFTEHVLDLQDFGDIAWRVANNVDPGQDCYYAYDKNGKQLYGMAIDGTRKYRKLDGFERDWPNTVVHTKETIGIVDEKWDKLGLGRFIISPSLKYKHQLYTGDAVAVEKNE
ncbi:MAG: hypothetical protein B6I19_05515 [Bacteroidetes bacterium 4572_114]|nr:MAG: hypothetical protein B6I19_05515 [Bacteroidetes bacterium 4572_114]